MGRKPIRRNQSVRSYRRQADEILAQARRGEIPWSQARAAVGAIKETVQMLLAENVLAARGIEDMEHAEHPMGQDGGYEDYAPHKRAKRARTTTTTSRRGTTAKGDAYDEVAEKLQD